MYGAPRVLLSYRGRPLLAQVLEEVMAACSIVHRFTSSYRPPANKLTERFNHTLAEMLSFYVT